MNDEKRKKMNKKYEDASKRAGGGETPKIELQDGINIIKLVDADFRENFVIYVESVEGKTRKINMTEDKGKNREKFAMVFDNASSDENPQHRYYFKAISASIEKKGEKKVAVLDNQVKLFECGPMVFKQLAAIQNDDEYPDIDSVNLKITKTGKKMNTEYQVLPGRKETELPDDLDDEIDLDEFVKLTSEKVICEIFGEEYTGEDDEYEEEEPKKKKKPVDEPKKKKKPVDEPKKKKRPVDEEEPKKGKDDDEDDDLDDLTLDDLDDD